MAELQLTYFRYAIANCLRLKGDAARIMFVVPSDQLAWQVAAMLSGMDISQLSEEQINEQKKQGDDDDGEVNRVRSIDGKIAVVTDFTIYPDMHWMYTRKIQVVVGTPSALENALITSDPGDDSISLQPQSLMNISDMDVVVFDEVHELNGSQEGPALQVRGVHEREVRGQRSAWHTLTGILA